MKTENHMIKVKRFKQTISKLDLEEDYETLIEDYLLAAAHLINASMHKLNVLSPDKDIKHNQLYGHLLREKSLGNHSEEVASLIQFIEQLRPSHVYGKGEDGETAKKAKEAFEKIEKICNKILSEK